MKFGLCGTPQMMDTARELGFDYLEMSASGIAAMDGDAFLALERKVQAPQGLPCTAFNGLFPAGMTVLGPGADSAQLRDYLHFLFARLQRLGGRIAVFGSGRIRKCPPGVSFFEACRELTRLTETVGEIASCYGITVAVEPLFQGECDLVNTVGEGAMLAAAVNRPNVGLLADFFHMTMEHETPREILRIGTFVHIHVASPSCGRSYPLPEQPDGYAAFFDALKAVRYGGGISIEGVSKNVRSDAARSLAYLKTFWADGDDPVQSGKNPAF